MDSHWVLVIALMQQKRILYRARRLTRQLLEVHQRHYDEVPGRQDVCTAWGGDDAGAQREQAQWDVHLSQRCMHRQVSESKTMAERRRDSVWYFVFHTPCRWSKTINIFLLERFFPH